MLRHACRSMCRSDAAKSLSLLANGLCILHWLTCNSEIRERSCGFRNATGAVDDALHQKGAPCSEVHSRSALTVFSACRRRRWRRTT